MIDEHYKHLVNLLAKSSIGEAYATATSSSNLPGIVSLMSHVSNGSVYDLIIDTGASHQTEFYKDVLESLQ